MTNSADPDQFLQKPTDLDLHCLQRQDISGFSRTRVKVKSYGIEYLGVYGRYYIAYENSEISIEGD